MSNAGKTAEADTQQKSSIQNHQHKMTMQHKSILISIPPETHKTLIELAKNVRCVSETGNPKAATTVAKTVRVVLNFYSDEHFQECLEDEGIDTLAFIQKCVRKNMKEVLGK